MSADATAINPDTATTVYLNGQPYRRDALETAWLLLGETDGNVEALLSVEIRLGYSRLEARNLVDAALRWTGNVVSSVTR